MAIVKHLGIAWALARFYVRIVSRRWFSRPPFLPLPPRSYVTWRMRTAYGGRRPAWRDVLRDVWQFGEWLWRFPNPRP